MFAKNSAVFNDIASNITQHIRQHQRKRQQAKEAKRAREEKKEFFKHWLKKARDKLRNMIQGGFIDLDVVKFNPIVNPAFVESCPELKRHQAERKSSYLRVFEVWEIPYHTSSSHVLRGYSKFDPLEIRDSDWHYFTQNARERDDYANPSSVSEETLNNTSDFIVTKTCVFSMCLNPHVTEHIFLRQCRPRTNNYKRIAKTFLKKALALNMFYADPVFFDKCWTEHVAEQARQRKQTAQCVMQQRLQTNKDLPNLITSFL